MMLALTSRLALSSICRPQVSSLLCGQPTTYYVQKNFLHMVKPKVRNVAPKVLMNRQIRASNVLLLDENGKKIGEMSLRDAIKMAEDKNLDVLCMNQNHDPPICKIYSYGKYKYDLSSKKKATTTKTKELRFNSTIAEHDVSNKVNSATRFLTSLMNVKITITFGGTPDMMLAEAMVDNIYSRVSYFARRDPTLLTANKFVSCNFYPLPEKVKRMKENPDKSVEELEQEAIDISAKKAAKEAARAARLASQPPSTATAAATTSSLEAGITEAVKPTTEANEEKVVVDANDDGDAEIEADDSEDGDENEEEGEEEEGEEEEGDEMEEGEDADEIEPVETKKAPVKTEEAKKPEPPSAKTTPIPEFTQQNSQQSAASSFSAKPKDAAPRAGGMWNQPKSSSPSSSFSSPSSSDNRPAWNQSQFNKQQYSQSQSSNYNQSNNQSQNRNQVYNNQNNFNQSQNNNQNYNKSYNNNNNNQASSNQSFNRSYNNNQSSSNQSFNRSYNNNNNNNNNNQSYNNNQQRQSFNNSKQPFDQRNQKNQGNQKRGTVTMGVESVDEDGKFSFEKKKDQK